MKIILLFLIFTIPFPQVIEPVKSFTIQSDFILTDALGTIYSIKGNGITTYNTTGQKLYSYSNPFLGNISFADVKDPMRILLFYKEFNKVIFLSNKLSEIGSPIELDNSGYSEAGICCTSNERGFWIFDQQLLQLIHLNENLEPLHKGTLLQHLFKNKTPVPACLLEENDELFLSVPGTGILIFDKFGSYLKTLPIMNVNRFQVIGGKIIYFQNSYLYSVSKELQTDSISFPADLKIISSSLFNNHLYSSNGNQLFLFNL